MSQPVIGQLLVLFCCSMGHSCIPACDWSDTQRLLFQVLPLHNSIRDKRRYPSVLALCMNITVIVNAIIAFLGYCRYGESIKGSITLNMPTHVWYALLTYLFLFHTSALFL